MGHSIVHTTKAHWGLLAPSKHTRKTPVLTVWVLSSCSLASSWLQQRKPLEDSRGQRRGTPVPTDLGLPSLMWDLSGWLLAMSCGQRMLVLWRWPSLPALPRWPWRAEGWDGGCCHWLGPCTQLRSSIYGPPLEEQPTY